MPSRRSSGRPSNTRLLTGRMALQRIKFISLRWHSRRSQSNFRRDGYWIQELNQHGNTECQTKNSRQPNGQLSTFVLSTGRGGRRRGALRRTRLNGAITMPVVAMRFATHRLRRAWHACGFGGTIVGGAHGRGDHGVSGGRAIAVPMVAMRFAADGLGRAGDGGGSSLSSSIRSRAVAVPGATQLAVNSPRQLGSMNMHVFVETISPVVPMWFAANRSRRRWTRVLSQD